MMCTNQGFGAERGFTSMGFLDSTLSTETPDVYIRGRPKLAVLVNSMSIILDSLKVTD
jgi:hypothetical protein